MAGISIPDDIAVLGVDDDDLLCEISDPPISSIQLEVEEGGYQACRLLHQRLLSKSVQHIHKADWHKGEAVNIIIQYIRPPRSQHNQIYR